ncbi:MAG: hypothetical protein WCK32_06415 [Chlorobiaceae bacterium]
MRREWKKAMLFFAVLSIMSFLINFCWESVQGLLYVEHPAMAAIDYVPMMLFMAAMDTFGIIILYAFTAIVTCKWFWETTTRNSSIFFLIGFFTAYAVEYISVFPLHLWHYLAGMPLVFGIGLFPLFQLSLTGIFSVYMANKLVFKG